MTDALFTPPPPRRPTLPEPQRERWQPLRLGLVELFHYGDRTMNARTGKFTPVRINGNGDAVRE